MTSAASVTQARSLSTATTWLGWISVALWTAAAVLIPVLDRANSELAGSIGNVSAAALIATGLLTYERTAPVLGFCLITLGALVGGVFLVYLLAPMVLAIALIVLVAHDTFSHQVA
jgi:hypothetical protein